MEKVLELISKEVGDAFEAAGYDRDLGRVTVSNRPDLCEYQCNGAMAGAKKYGKAPFIIADDVAARLQDNDMFEKVESVKPGFLNITVSGDFVRGYVVRMLHEKHLGVNMPGHAPTIILDYGGANVAKPLHVGHLRPAIIGEAVKRILKYAGNKVIGDIHMGDWGLQMGLIITELKCRQPDLCYFDPEFKGPFPKEAPFTIQELAEIYPVASAKSKAADDASEEEKKAAEEYRNSLKIKTSSVDRGVTTLSGGNQQKVVLSKWMFTEPDILILDEPTRGIDVGAKYEIYKLIHQLADEGKAVILVSSELPELLGMADRIYTIFEGTITGEIDSTEASQEGLMKRMTITSN